MYGPCSTPQTASVCPKSSGSYSIPSYPATSKRPPIPTDELMATRKRTSRAPPKSPCNNWFARVIGLRKLRKKFLIPLRAGRGVMVLYPLIIGFIMDLSTAMLKAITCLFCSSIGS